MGAIPLSNEREELVDQEVVLRFLMSAAFWLVFAPTIGVILSIDEPFQTGNQLSITRHSVSLTR